uniref:Uncharacterized protein n=1 Tax=Hyaloperonospora arabidopsidis (strain Emoy2) TaxID=559515 RepID=M4B3C0_HYAAE
MALLWLVALLLGLAGAGYMYAQHRMELQRQDVKLQKEKEELARQHFHSLNSKKHKSKTKKKVDVTAEFKRKKEGAVAKEDEEAEHERLLHVLKGHKFGLTAAAYSPNGRFVATASSDRSIRLYFRETLKQKQPKVHQITMEYDHATALSFSTDGRSLVVATENGTVKVYQKLRAKPELVADFPTLHKTDVHSVLMNDISSWATIITCAGDSDTDVKFWNLSGELLQTVNTNQVANYHCVSSKDNRYIAVAAYTPEVKIYEIAREKSGAFRKVSKIMTLQGHRMGVVDIAFDGSDAFPVNRVVTISKDVLVRLWDINVRYTLQEDPKAVDFAPNGKMLVMVRGKDLVFVRAGSSDEFCTIPNAIEDSIKRAVFSPDGSEVLVLGKNCKHVKVYKTPEL